MWRSLSGARTRANSRSPRAAASTPTTSSNISVRAESSIMCFEGWRPDRHRACGRNRRLGRRSADPARICAHHDGQGHRQIAGLSGRSTWSGAAGFVINGWWHRALPSRGTEHGLAADRSDRVMANLEEKKIVDLSHVIEDGMTTYQDLPARTSATSGRAKARPRITTTDRASRSAGSTWSPIPAPISIRPFTAMPMARTSRNWP